MQPMGITAKLVSHSRTTKLVSAQQGENVVSIADREFLSYLKFQDQEACV